MSKPRIEKVSCFGCIRPGICYLEKSDLEEDMVGWCDKCSTCRRKDCQNPIQQRVYWAVGCHEQFNLHTDVCDDHVNDTPERDCECSKTACNIISRPYFYL